jgi:acetyl-CoA decarbonylase/synthase complex subunit gamma
MALSGLDIFKKLPQTNCGDCGVPTCLAFAMKLAQGQAELSACPHVSEEAAAELSESAAPPMRGITIGTGEHAFMIGEETVLFRHDKTFVNPCGIGVLVESGADDDEIDAVTQAVGAAVFERVQQELRTGCVAVKSTADAPRFAEVARRVAEATGLPLVLMSEDASEMKTALETVGDGRPLIHAATEANLDEMVALASENECPLAVRAPGLDALASLAEKAAAAGVKDLVLDSAPATAGAALRDRVLARRAALEQKFTPLGYPIMSIPGELAGDDRMLENLYAAADVTKYAGLVILSSTEPERVLPLLVLRQNIYTDPQRPMQVEQKVYEFGSPGPDAPLFVTTNFSLTYFIVASEIETSKRPARLAIVDCEGLSVLTAWAAGKFIPERIAKMIGDSGVSEEIEHREIIIPGMVAQISGELVEELDGWNVTVGPREAAEIPAFLKQKAG